MIFEELSLDESILAGVAAAGFEECTEVQEKAIPLVLEGRDVAVQSQTGTGKTAAFLLPIFHLLRHSDRFRDTRVLIIAPTRELAAQIKDESDVLSRGLGIASAAFYGGVGYAGQQKDLASDTRILVGTPGRLLDLNQSGYFDFRQIGILVIDEADRLFDMGFYPDIRKMLQRMRPREERLNMLFSATLSVKARNIAWEHMNDPAEIEIEPEQVTVERVEQKLYHVSGDEKMALLLGVLKRYNPKSAIIFTNTKKQAEIIAKRLDYNGYPAEFIMGDLPQSKRLKIIERIKSGQSEFLVATDVAARGLHIKSLDMVINFDIPEDAEAYVHRIGRTARAGAEGLAVSLACQRYVYGLEAIEKLIGMKIPVETYSEEMLLEDQSKGHYIELDQDDRRGGAGRSRDSRDRGRGRSRSSGPRREPVGASSRGGRSSAPRAASERGRSDRTERENRSRSRKPEDRRPDIRRPEERGSESRSTGERRPPDSRPSGDRRPDRAHKRPQNSQRAEGRPASGRPQRGAGSSQGDGPGSVPRRGDTVEQRIAYYRSKYGEDFKPTDEMLRNMGGEPSKPKKKRGLFGRLFGK